MDCLQPRHADGIARARALVLGVVTALVLGGCGDDKGGAEGRAPVAVEIRDLEFVPARVTIEAGTTVRWTNGDELVHTVTKTSGSGAPFDSGNVMPGSYFEQRFDEPGRVGYVCVLHVGQEGVVVVK